MSRHLHLVLWVPLLYSAFFLIFFARMYINEFVQFDEFVLAKQSNYAAESAVDEMIALSDINTDYANGDFVMLNPEYARDDFCHTMCLDMGLVPTDKAKKMVADKNIKAMLVCVYDGTYAYWPMKTDTSSYELTQSPKIPYFFEKGDMQYCLTLDPTVGYWDYTDSTGKYKVHKYDKYAESDDHSGKRPSNDEQATAINDQVSKILNWVLYESYSGGGSGKVYELPALAETIRGNQPINRPTVIAITEGRATSVNSTITAECVGGARVTDSNRVAACTIHGAGGYNGKYYAYESWWKNHATLWNSSTERKYFDTAFDAAADGYHDLNLN